MKISPETQHTIFIKMNCPYSRNILMKLYDCRRHLSRGGQDASKVANV